jgi:hypothetical protein
MLSVPEKLKTRNPDVTLGDDERYLMVDSRYVPPEDWQFWKEVMEEAHLQLAPEIHCKGTPERTMSLVQQLAGPSAAAAIQEFETQIDPERVSEQEMLGDIFPIRFVVYENGSPVGGFEWYGIKVIASNEGVSPPERHLQGMPFPAFQRMGTLEEQMKLTADICEIYLAHEGVMIEGYRVRPMQIVTYTFVDQMRGSGGDAQCAAWNAEIDARAANPRSQIRVVKSVSASGREERLITCEA